MKFILERLAVGNEEDARKEKGKFGAILCVADNVDLRLDGCLCKIIPIKDFCPIPAEQMTEAIVWISEHIKNHKILVFCKAGISRSASVIIGYLISIGFGFGEAVEFVAKKNSSICSVPGLIDTVGESLGKLSSSKISRS